MNRKIIPLALATVMAAGPVASSFATAAQAVPLRTPAPITAPAYGVPGAERNNAGLYKEAQYRRRGWRRGSRDWRGRHYRGHRYRHHRRGVGGSIAAGIAGALALGIIANANRVSRSRSDWRRCDARYRSFRWSDGTFQPYNGPRRLCPYLR